MNDDQLEFLSQFVHYLHSDVEMDAHTMSHGLELLESYLNAAKSLFQYAHFMSQLMNGKGDL